MTTTNRTPRQPNEVEELWRSSFTKHRTTLCLGCNLTFQSVMLARWHACTGTSPRQQELQRVERLLETVGL